LESEGLNKIVPKKCKI